MSTLLSGKRREATIWLPGQGRYLSRLKLGTLRNYLHRLFGDAPGRPVSQQQATLVLQQLWCDARLGREPGNSHAYRHLLALRLLGLVAPHGEREGYALAPLGARLLGMGGWGDELTDDERRLLACAMFSPPQDMDSPLLAFAHLFAPTANTAAEFRDLGRPILLRRLVSTALEVTTTDDTVHITDEEAVDHVLWGCRELFLEVGLIGELLPESVAPFWQRRLFPVRKIEAAQFDDAIQAVVSHLRSRLEQATRLSIPALSAEVRPRMHLTSDDYRTILTRISKDFAGEFYFDRLSSILIAGREEAYVRIGDYWRSSIVRY